MSDERYRQAKKVTVIGAFVNACLGVIKCIGGVLYNSHALIADGIHSLSDLLTDIMVIIASKYGSQEADESHPYGHQRFETAATLLLALFLILAGIGIAWDSIRDILQNTQDTPQLLALPIAVISIVANEILYHYTLQVGEKIQSDLIKANAWHHRSDALSSIVVVFGLVGAFLGYGYFDGVAAIIVGALIIKMGLDYGWSSVKQLVDTSASSGTLNQVERIINQVDGVKCVHQLRTRLMGSDVYIDVHIQVPPKISVSEGHYIAQQVHKSLIDNAEGIKDVTVHIDPEDDEVVCPSMHLPSRSTLENHYLLKWKADFPEIESWLLHYLDGKLSVELILNTNIPVTSGLLDQIRKDTKVECPIEHVSILVKKTLFN